MGSRAARERGVPTVAVGIRGRVERERADRTGDAAARTQLRVVVHAARGAGSAHGADGAGGAPRTGRTPGAAEAALLQVLALQRVVLDLLADDGVLVQLRLRHRTVLDIAGPDRRGGVADPADREEQ